MLTQGRRGPGRRLRAAQRLSRAVCLLVAALAFGGTFNPFISRGPSGDPRFDTSRSLPGIHLSPRSGKTFRHPLLAPSNNDTPLRLSSWLNLSTPSAPPARSQAALVYDAAANYTVLFGGVTQNATCRCTVILNDTWIFTQGDWKQLHPHVSPPARYDASATFDAQVGRVLLFGGRANTKFFNDTWEFVGGNWTIVNATSAPSPREGSGLAYYPAGRYALLYSGFGINVTGARV